jgi:uncharacterized SAM-binding protein YcdF (DUF218 family)
MSLLLSKLATRLVLPLGATLALLVVGLVFLAARRPRLGGACVAAAGLLLWLASTPVVADRLVASLERSQTAPPLASLAPADAILLLGGAMKPALPPREFVEVGDPADRVLHAARLYEAGKAPVVLVSGGRLPWQTRGAPEAVAIEELLVVLGVPREAILREEASANTYENCVRSAEILHARHAHDVLLVTSALHMRRALATCRSAGIAVRPAPTDYQVVEQGPALALDWSPDVQALLLSHLALHEWIGFEAYAARGWIRRAAAEAPPP